MNVMKRVLSLLLSMALLVSYVPAVAFAEETEIPAETEIVAAEETLAPTEAVTEPAEETAAPTEAATEPTTEETAAPTEAATEPPETTPEPSEEATEPVEETVAPTEAVTEPIEETEAVPETQSTPEVKHVAIPFTVNPLYEGIFTESDFPARAEPASNSDEESDHSDMDYWHDQEMLDAPTYLSVKKATAKLKQYLLKRDTSFTLYFKADSDDYDEYLSEMLLDAFKHTGKPKEGDYLQWHFAGWGGSIDYSWKDGKYCFIFKAEVYYLTTEAQEEKLDTAVTKLLKSLNVSDKSNYKKIKAVYDYICQNVTYDYDHLEDDSYVLKHSAYAALVKKTAVCQGYATLLYRILLELDVDVRVIAGLAEDGSGHAWNIAKIGKVYYNLDATWDAGYDEYYYFLRNSINFPYHYRYLEYATTQFHTKYPMAQDDYVEGVAGVPEQYFVIGQCGDEMAFAIDREQNLVIAGNGPMWDFDQATSTGFEDAAPWYAWMDAFENVIIEEGVTSIGEMAFYNMKNITSVTLPDTLASINYYAFGYCRALKEIVLPDSLEVIKGNAFYTCSGLTEIIIPDKITRIEMDTFCKCYDLQSVTFGANVAYIGSQAFRDTGLTEVVLPGTIMTVDSHAFYSCDDLQYVEFEGSMETIGGSAFGYCPSLSKVEFPEDLKIIGNGAFESTGLTEIVLPDTVTELGSSAFKYCRNLQYAKIGSSVKSLSYTFFGCTSLTKVELPEGLTGIGENVFEGTALVEITIPSSVTHIGHKAFYNCESLISITIPNNVTTIEDYAFASCNALKKITFRGDAPDFGGRFLDGKSVFSTVVATVYYPAENETWTKDVRKNYGGTITWVSICETCDFSIDEIVAPTCTEDGSRYRVCSRCNYTESKVYPATGHSYESAVTEHTYTKDGYTTHTCTVCGDTYTDAHVNAPGLSRPAVEFADEPVTGGGILTWEAVPEADSYRIYRATSKSGKYKLLETVEGTELEVKVSVGKTYYYKVKAICEADSDLNSSYSSVVKVTGKCAQPEIAVTPVPASGKPCVKGYEVSGAEEYEIYRSTNATEGFKKIKTTSKTSYTDSKAELGVTYYYKVKAIASKSTYNSAFSEIDSCLTILAQPDAELSINKTTGKPVIEWEKVSGAISYEILRAEAEKGEYTKLSSQTELSFEDSTAEPDKDYWYKVNAIGAEERLNSIDGDAEMIHATLAKPVVSFGVNSISGKPVMTWEEVEGAVEYKIYRSSKSKTSYKCIETTTDLSYSDDSVKAGKGYYYKVIAIGENCKSSYSSYKKLTAKCAQPEITAIGVDPVSGKPAVKWNKVSGAEKYYVYRATEENGTYEKVKTTTSTSYTDTSAKVGTTYYYKVKAVASKSTYNSIYSEVESCLTILAQPEVTLETVSSTGKPSVSWEAVEGAIGYEIYRSENDGEYELIATQEELEYTDEEAVIDSKYSYKVKAIAEDPELNSAERTTEIVTATCAKPKASIELSSKKPSISWDSVEGATKYYVYRSTKKSSGYKKIATVELEDGASYRDSKAKKGTTYYYKIVAVSENAKSAYSSVVKIKSK